MSVTTSAPEPSPVAAAALSHAIMAGLSPFAIDVDDLEGATDCPSGCVVEPDGICPHDFESAARTAGFM